MQRLRTVRIGHLPLPAAGHRHQRAGRLHEEERRLAAAGPHFDRMVCIVLAHTEHPVYRKGGVLAVHGHGRNGHGFEYMGHGRLLNAGDGWAVEAGPVRGRAGSSHVHGRACGFPVRNQRDPARDSMHYPRVPGFGPFSAVGACLCIFSARGMGSWRRDQQGQTHASLWHGRSSLSALLPCRVLPRPRSWCGCAPCMTAFRCHISGSPGRCAGCPRGLPGRCPLEC